ncbi:hypothetical protein AGMMS49982_17190 [Bacteroidia bacterium]|nr:hypothetical protein AGMMS49982_17190 [Bacteroidia bacterium]
MKKLLGMIMGVVALQMASCADDYEGTMEVGDGVKLYNTSSEVLQVAASVDVKAKFVGQSSAKISYRKNSVDTKVKDVPVADDGTLTASLTFAEVDLSHNVGDVATILIEADGVLYTHQATVVAPEWKWSAIPSPAYSLMENSLIEDTLTFFVKASWVEEGRSIVVDSVKGDRGHTLANFKSSTMVQPGKINLGYVDFKLLGEAYLGDGTDSKSITVYAHYTSSSNVTISSTFTTDYSTKQDTYSKSAAYTFTEANVVSAAIPNSWGWADELKTFYGLYDGKEYVGRPTGDAAKQPVLYIYDSRIYNLFNTGDYKLAFCAYNNPQGLGLTDRSLAEAASGSWDEYARVSFSDLNTYYHVRIGGGSGDKGVGTLHLRATIDGKVEFSLKYGDKRQPTRHHHSSPQ